MAMQKRIGVINPKGEVQSFSSMTELANHIHSKNSEYYRTVGMTVGALIRRLTRNLPEGGSYLNYTRLSQIDKDPHEVFFKDNRANPVYVLDLAFHQILHYTSCRNAGLRLGVDFRRVSSSILHSNSFSAGRFRAFLSESESKEFLDRYISGDTGPRVLYLHGWKIFASEDSKRSIIRGDGIVDLLGELRNRGSRITEHALASFCSRMSRKNGQRVVMPKSANPTKQLFIEMVFQPKHYRPLGE